ncbi:topless-related protein 2-like protein isoform X1 [Tanacetum coccineum]
MLRMHLWNSKNKDINRISVMLYVQMPEILELCKQIKENLKEADLYEFGPHHVIWLGKWFLTWTKMDLLDTSFGPKSGAALSRDNEIIIVNEYGSNGSLDCYLEDTNKRRNLTWVKWATALSGLLFMPANSWNQCILDANIYWQSFIPVYMFKEDLDHGVLLVGYGSAGYVPSRLKEKPMKIFFELRKQKYLEALDRQVYNPLFLWHVIGGVWNDRAKAVEILVKDLKVFSTLNEELFKKILEYFLGQHRTTEHETFTNMKTKFMALWDGFTTDPALCEGYTGSDLLELCKKAAYFPIKDLLNEEKKGKSSPMSLVFAWQFLGVDSVSYMVLGLFDTDGASVRYFCSVDMHSAGNTVSVSYEASVGRFNYSVTYIGSLCYKYSIIDMVAHSSEFENIFVRDEEQNKLETLVHKAYEGQEQYS